jgi:hypothetical protein
LAAARDWQEMKWIDDAQPRVRAAFEEKMLRNGRGGTVQMI